MVESVKVKAEGSVFSIKKGTILSDLIPRLKLPHEPLLATIDEQIVERKRGQKNGARPHFLKIENRKKKMGPGPIFVHFF